MHVCCSKAGRPPCLVELQVHTNSWYPSCSWCWLFLAAFMHGQQFKAVCMQHGR